jgi:hypothetical protein
MMNNRTILAAVLAKWAQPAINQMTSGRLDTLPFLAAISNKVRSTGWVSPQWSLGKELSPLLGNAVNSLVEPLIASYLQGVPDEAIPNMAHSIVDEAIKQGELSLFEGNVIFEKEDLEELKNYLDYNLPLAASSQYVVKTGEEEEEA